MQYAEFTEPRPISQQKRSSTHVTQVFTPPQSLKLPSAHLFWIPIYEGKWKDYHDKFTSGVTGRRLLSAANKDKDSGQSTIKPYKAMMAICFIVGLLQML